MVYITPVSWFSISKKNKKLRESIINRKILYIDVATANTKYFKGIGNNFVWFVIQNNEVHNNIVDTICLYNKHTYESQIDQHLFNIGFIPLLLTNESLSIINKMINNKYDKIKAKLPYEYEPRKSHVIKSQPSIKDFVTVRSTKGNILYSLKKTDNYDKYKIIIPSTTNYEKLCITKDCTTQSFINIYCESEEEAVNIRSMLLLKPYIFFNNLCRWGNWNYAEIISLFPIIYTDNIYKSLDFNKNEIELINNILTDNVDPIVIIPTNDNDIVKKPTKKPSNK